jgi:hypothetical protein
MLLLVFLGSAALWAQDPEPEVEASDDDAQVEAEASPPADEVTDEEIDCHMNKKNIPVEFVYQLFALIIAIIIVHAFYVSVVRPNAAEVIAEQNLMAEADPDFVRERSVWVLVKDLGFSK